MRSKESSNPKIGRQGNLEWVIAIVIDTNIFMGKSMGFEIWTIHECSRFKFWTFQSNKQGSYIIV